MNKKAFTLVEMMISITIFSILITFLYQSLEHSKNFNNTFSKHVQNYMNSSHLQNILSEDIIEAKTKFVLEKNKNKNSILKITNSNNTFHNAFNKYITYLVTRKNKLIRIESSKEYLRKKSGTSFFEHEDTYVDVLAKDVKKFVVIQNKKNKDNALSIYIQTLDSKEFIISAKKFIP